MKDNSEDTGYYKPSSLLQSVSDSDNPTGKTKHFKMKILTSKLATLSLKSPSYTAIRK